MTPIGRRRPAEPTASTRRYALAVVVAAVVAIVVAGVGAQAVEGVAVGAAEERAEAFALLTDGRVVDVTRDARPRSLGRVEPQRPEPIGGGPLVQATRTHVLVVGGGKRPGLHRLRRAGGSSQRVAAIPAEAQVGAVVIGPRTGRVYVLANTEANGVTAAVVYVLTPSANRLLVSRTVRAPAARIFAAAAAGDESRLAVAYHGAADGFDLLPRASLTPPCLPTAVDGCTAGHGSVHFVGSRVFTSTGDRWFDEVTPSGLRRRDSRLAGNHFLEMASDGEGEEMLLLGSCRYGGGLARVDLRTTRVRVLSPPGRRGVCGRRMAVLGSNLLVASDDVSGPSRRPDLVVVRRENGRPVWRARTGARILDLVVAPAAAQRGRR